MATSGVALRVRVRARVGVGVGIGVKTRTKTRTRARIRVPDFASLRASSNPIPNTNPNPISPVSEPP